MSNPGPPTSIEVRTSSAIETQQLAARLASLLLPGDIVTLEGELGSGKTCFVRGMAQGLGINPAKVSSPTFVIVHEYHGSQHILTHIDAYRITSEDDLETIGWSEMLESKDAIVAVEWPSRIACVLPSCRHEVRIEAISEHDRVIRIFAPQNPGSSLSVLLSPPAHASPTHSGPLCRTCREPIAPGASTFPFCSQRCRMADLGGWFAGRYSVSRPMQSDDELTE